MEQTKIITWLASLRGKNRYELRNDATDLDCHNGYCLTYDVYDDYLIFSKLDAKTWDATPLTQMLIDSFNNCDLDALADSITNKM